MGNISKASKDRFQVRPVAAYHGAQYPAPLGPDDELVEERTHPAVQTLIFLLVVGLTVGLVGCYMRSDYHADDPEPEPVDDPEPEPECEDGQVRCDGSGLETCVDEEWARRECSEICAESHGYEAHSYGCQEGSQDQCLCEYGLEQGVAPECNPSDVWCVDEQNVEYCPSPSPSWMQVTDCNSYCAEMYGPDAFSPGCDDNAHDPCQCQYGMVDGGPRECPPGYQSCAGEQSIVVCGENGEHITQSCDQYCTDRYGAEPTASECDDTLDDPCQCAYD